MKAKKQPKAKAVKAVRQWAWMVNKGLYGTRLHNGAKRLAILDISDSDALVEQVAECIAGATLNDETDRSTARLMLQSLGIIPARKAKK